MNKEYFDWLFPIYNLCHACSWFQRESICYVKATTKLVYETVSYILSFYSKPYDFDEKAGAFK